MTQFTDPSAARHREHHLRIPSGQLSRFDKLRREAMHRRFLCGGLILLFIVGCYAAAFDLGAWASWVVLGGILVTVIGLIIAISPRRSA